MMHTGVKCDKCGSTIFFLTTLNLDKDVDMNRNNTIKFLSILVKCTKCGKYEEIKDSDLLR